MRSLGFFHSTQKRGQVAIFIFVGLLVLLLIVLFFFLFARDTRVATPPSVSPRDFIDRCILDSVNPSIDLVLDYGGLIGPRMFIQRNNHEYNYHCFTDSYYSKCYNYYPMLRRITEQEIKKDSVARIEECFDFLVEDYELRDFDVESGELFYNVEIIPGSVRLTIRKPIKVSREDSASSFEVFNQKISSDLYELIVIARNIVSQEATHCYFENVGFMNLYPEYNITRIDYLESKIYEVENRRTKEVLRFATRSCAFAPGFEGSEFR